MERMKKIDRQELFGYQFENPLGETTPLDGEI